MEIKFKVQKAPTTPKPRLKNNTQPSTLAFVQVNPAKKDKAAQRKIRQHVMKDIGLSRRMGTIRTPHPTSESIFIPTYWGDAQVCYNFRRLFRAMDMVSEGLLSIAIVDPVLRLRQEITATFESPPTVEQVQQYTESLSLVREGIEVESKASENAVIGTVICLATFDMRAGNSESWMVHMAGLERIVAMAGGVEELDSRPAIRQSLFIDSAHLISRRNNSVKQLMAQLDDKFWKGKEELQLWVLVIQVCMGVGSSKPWYLDQITRTMSRIRLRSWEDLMNCLRKVVWIEKVSPLEMTHLRSDIGEWLS
ncbi:hypothetical protein LB504_006114 [Fusarium proliferatum]|nr:hypothetical protein LB504_006114 [Fusarium proliferatum]